MLYKELSEAVHIVESYISRVVLPPHLLSSFFELMYDPLELLLLGRENVSACFHMSVQMGRLHKTINYTFLEAYTRALKAP